MELDLIEYLNQQMLNKTLIFFFFIFGVAANAQLPNSNMYLFTLTKGGGKYTLKSPQFLTAFNINGYNNQPAFLSDDEIYFTTNYYEEDQTEIAKFDIFEESLTRITYTDESEYSPLPVPHKDEFSCVRAETDGKTQTLSVYPLDGIGYAKRFMNNTNNIGYHNWIDDKTVALFLVGPPDHSLAIADAKSERRKIILDKIGRSLKVDRNEQLYFVHKMSDKDWYIKSYDRNTSKSKVIVKTLQGSEDFELMNDGSIIMASGSVVYHYNPKNNTDWKPILDLTDYGIENISRIAARKNRLVIVDQKL